jgi:hypothetical protein
MGRHKKGAIGLFNETILKMFSKNGELLKGKDHGLTVDEMAKRYGVKVDGSDRSRHLVRVFQICMRNFKRFCYDHLGEVFDSVKYDRGRSKSLYMFAKTADEFATMLQATRKRKNNAIHSHDIRCDVGVKQLEHIKNKEERKLLLKELK